MSDQERDQEAFNYILAVNRDIKRYLNLAPSLKPVASDSSAANGQGKSRSLSGSADFNPCQLPRRSSS